MLRSSLLAFLLVSFLALAATISPGLSAEEAASPPVAATDVADVAPISAGDTAVEVPGVVRQLHDRMRQVVQNAPTALSDLDRAVASSHANINEGWLKAALLKAAVCLAIAVVIAEAVAALLRHIWLKSFPAQPSSRIQKLCFLATHTVIGMIAAVVIMLVGFLANNIASGADPATYMTIMVVVAGGATLRALVAVTVNMLSPRHPSYRVVPLDDRQATRVYRSLVAALAICTIALSGAAWVSQLPIDRDAFRLVHIVATFVSMLALSSFVLRQRSVVATAMAASTGRPAPGWRKLLAGSWHLIAVAYFCVAWVVSGARVLLDTSGGIGLVTSPAVIIVVAVALYGLLLVVIDAVFRKTDKTRVLWPDGTPLPTFQDLAEHAAAVVVAIASFMALFSIWGVALFNVERTLGTRFLEEIVIVLVAYFAYQATKIVIDRRLLAESSGELHSTSSRIATLLHLLRGFALTTIVVMAVMVGLSEIGINIGPLFAGAGVVGLAIGFGAQTLIKDIFSGAFFLIDDAFRRGEYIDIGVAKGTVERISIRSLQLRHQNGPLSTIPFGAIDNVQNFSRDWVTVKIPLRLIWSTDVNKVRKIIKTIGQQLAEDPEIGPKLLEPVKSQGIYGMDDAGMIVRIKFTTRPGDQFLVRRTLYAKIVEEFAAQDIRFSSREVMVRVAQDDAAGEFPAAAGAAIASALANEAEARKQTGLA